RDLDAEPAPGLGAGPDRELVRHVQRARVDGDLDDPSGLDDDHEPVLVHVQQVRAREVLAVRLDLRVLVAGSGERIRPFRGGETRWRGHPLAPSSGDASGTADTVHQSHPSARTSNTGWPPIDSSKRLVLVLQPDFVILFVEVPVTWRGHRTIISGCVDSRRC